MRYRILDIATAPLPDVEQYIGPINPRKGTKDAEKQAEQIAEKRASILETAACDPDLCRITAIGWWGPEEDIVVEVCRDETDERDELVELGQCLAPASGFDTPNMITFNGNAFDLVVLQRRARYLGVEFPKLNLDRYRSPHVDLMQELSDRDARRYRSLEFYRKRLNLGPDKPMSGADEARVFETGAWDLLEQSVRHDVTTIKGIAQWLGYLPASAGAGPSPADRHGART